MTDGGDHNKGPVDPARIDAISDTVFDAIATVPHATVSEVIIALVSLAVETIAQLPEPGAREVMIRNAMHVLQAEAPPPN